MIKQIKFIGMFTIGAMTLSSCGKNALKHSASPTAVGIDLNLMDTTVSPKTDFYNYVNGGWDKKTTIPADEGRWGSFNELRDINDSMSLALVDKALNNDAIDSSTDEGKVVTFFKTAMDTKRLNLAATQPIAAILDKVEKINNPADVLNYIIDMEPYLGGLFGIGIGADPKNSNVNALYLGGGNLGLPERDYYISNDDESKDKRALYVDHITRMFGFLGDSKQDAREQAERILSFETKMASAMLTKEERRDPLKTYNPKSLKEIKAIAPKINWDKYFDKIGATGYKEIIVGQPDYLKAAHDLMHNEPIGTIKEYLKWCALNDAANYLSENIEAANFDFYGKTLRGTLEQKPRKERTLSRTNRILGEALGKLYVKEYFPAEAKQVAKELVDNILIAFGDRIQRLDWMSTDTKKMAMEKLATFNIKIGYPDKWKDYSQLKVQGWDDGGSYYQNILNARKWNFDQDIVKIGKDVDKSEWFMSPQTVNAYYNPPYNEIVFPAAILQPPFFDFKADPAVNYGGIGAVIGHEVSHGFDDQGSQYDAEGNLNDWWTDADKTKFKELTTRLVEQYNAYEPLPGVHVNGEFTLGENIGDLGGVNVAYEGLQRHYKTNTNPGMIDGLTQDQRFFINWATVWRTKFRDEFLKNQIKTNPHAPGQYRATGPLVNVDAFHKSFDIRPGDAMYKSPEDRIKIW